MAVFRTVLVGTACSLFALALHAAPRPDQIPPNPSSTTVATTAPGALQTAMRRVWEASPQVQAARAELDAARARAQAAAQPLYNPSLDLSAENADVNRRTAGLSLTLDLSGKRRARANQGQADLRVSEASYTLLRRDIAAQWLTAWSTATLAARQAELGRQRLAMMKRFDELAAKRLKIGVISSPERDLAGLALGEARVQQATLEGNEAAARASLVAIGGKMAGRLPPLPQVLPPHAESVRPRPLDELPKLVQARSQLASAQAGVTVARRARIPDPTLSLTGGQVRNGPITDQVIGLSVSIPLPVLNTGRAEVAAANAEVSAASASMRAKTQLARATLQEAQARYNALRSAAKAFRQGRAAAFEERTALLEKLWRAGEIGTSDYLIQLKQSLDTALSGQELESRTWRAWFDYLTAAGRLVDWIHGRPQDISR